MADFIYKGVLGGGEPEHKVFNVASGAAASIAIGDLVVVANGYAAKIANGGGGAGNILTGLAISTSTDTVAADGTVEVLFHPSGLIVEGDATTAANLVTGVIFDKVTVDVDGSGNQTIDESNAGAILIYELDSDSATTGRVRVVLPWTLAS